MQTQEQLQPHQYPKRILVVVSGMSPQILTETLYALIQRQQPAFVPTEIHLVSTASGARHARLTLLEGDAQFLRLCNDYGLDPAIFTVANIHTICDAHGNVLDDIRTPADNEAAADFITGKIRELADTEGSAIHVSMAGGRKTMGYYAGYALSLYGRPQDRLSHVLVSEGFEGHRDFYYPTPAAKTIYREGKPALDASEAVVELAQIPFVRLREELPEKHRKANLLLSGRHSFTAAVQAAEKIRQHQHVQLNLQTLEFFCNGEPFNLGAANMAFLCWLAYRQHNGQSQLCDFRDEALKDYGLEFVEFCEMLDSRDQYLTQQARNKGGKHTSPIFPGIESIIQNLRPYGFASRGDFDYRLTRIKQGMEEVFGYNIANQLAPRNNGKRGAPSYGLVDFEEHYTVIT